MLLKGVTDMLETSTQERFAEFVLFIYRGHYYVELYTEILCQGLAAVLILNLENQKFSNSSGGNNATSTEI